MTKNIEKSIAETNPCSKKVCMQKGIGFIDDKKIKEEFLGTKKLNLREVKLFCERSPKVYK